MKSEKENSQSVGNDSKSQPVKDMKIGPRFPWEVAGKEQKMPKAEQRASSKVSVFAGAGKIDVLDKITRLRREMERAFSDRDRLREKVTRLEKECKELQQENVSLKQEKDDWEERESVWEEEKAALVKRAEDLEQRLGGWEGEKRQLESQLETAKKTVMEISSALEFGDDYIIDADE